MNSQKAAGAPSTSEACPKSKTGGPFEAGRPFCIFGEVKLDSTGSGLSPKGPKAAIH